jgi:hypothetical protein
VGTGETGELVGNRGDNREDSLVRRFGRAIPPER